MAIRSSYVQAKLRSTTPPHLPKHTYKDTHTQTHNTNPQHQPTGNHTHTHSSNSHHGRKSRRGMRWKGATAHEGPPQRYRSPSPRRPATTPACRCAPQCETPAAPAPPANQWIRVDDGGWGGEDSRFISRVGDDRDALIERCHSAPQHSFATYLLAIEHAVASAAVAPEAGGGQCRHHRHRRNHHDGDHREVAVAAKPTGLAGVTVVAVKVICNRQATQGKDLLAARDESRDAARVINQPTPRPKNQNQNQNQKPKTNKQTKTMHPPRFAATTNQSMSRCRSAGPRPHRCWARRARRLSSAHRSGRSGWRRN